MRIQSGIIEMKLKDITTVWQVPKYLPYLQPPLTDEILKEAEKLIGGKLPKAYVDLLKIQNGGYIRFTLPDTVHSQIRGIGPYFPSITEFDWLEEYEGTVGFELKGLIPFDGDGHWNICLDYRKNKVEPEITYIDTELDEEKPIAKTFQEYLGMLELEISDDGNFIDTDQTLEATVHQISMIAKIDFEKPDHFAHGYPIYRSKYKGSWVWVSPNKVPAAFIRAGEKRYDELKSYMDTYSTRFPEVPDTSIFISVSDDDQRRELFDLFSRAGVKLTRLKDVIDSL